MTYAELGAADITARTHASTDLSASRHKLATMASTQRVDVTGAVATNDATGVFQDNHDAAHPGDAAQVRIFGVTKVIAGDVIACGALLAPSGTVAGRVLTATTGDRSIGRALEAATVAGQVIAAIITPFGHKAL